MKTCSRELGEIEFFFFGFLTGKCPAPSLCLAIRVVPVVVELSTTESIQRGFRCRSRDRVHGILGL